MLIRKNCYIITSVNHLAIHLRSSHESCTIIQISFIKRIIYFRSWTCNCFLSVVTVRVRQYMSLISQNLDSSKQSHGKKWKDRKILSRCLTVNCSLTRTKYKRHKNRARSNQSKPVQTLSQFSIIFFFFARPIFHNLEES